MSDRIIFLIVFLSILIIFAVVIFIYLLLKGHREWKEKLKINPIDRQIKTKEEFIKYFAKKGFSIETTNFVYERTQKFLRTTDIVLLPEDDLIFMYERQNDEWNYALEKWFKEIRKNYPKTEQHEQLLEKHKQINFEYIIELFEENT